MNVDGGGLTVRPLVPYAPEYRSPLTMSLLHMLILIDHDDDDHHHHSFFHPLLDDAYVLFMEACNSISTASGGVVNVVAFVTYCTGHWEIHNYYT